MVKTVNWNGENLHCIEWEIDKNLEWCFFGSEVVKILEYKDNYNTVLNGNSKTKAKVKDKYKIKVSKKDLISYLGESPTLEISKKGDILITELGVYEAIMKSDMPLAEQFQDWVFNMLKQLRSNAGLEAYEVFRMMDKQVQKDIMGLVVKYGDLSNDAVNSIRANQNVNKIISCEFFGFNKPLTKPEMEKHQKCMLIDRQEVLVKYADNLMICDGSHTKAYELTTKWLKLKHGHLLAI